MGTRFPIQPTLGQRLHPEAEEVAPVSGPRLGAILTLLLVVVALLAGPAVLAGISIVDSSVLGGAVAWAQELSTWISHLSHAPLVLALPLAASVARAKEDG